jgi:hypothetical protein
MAREAPHRISLTELVSVGSIDAMSVTRMVPDALRGRDDMLEKLSPRLALATSGSIITACLIMCIFWPRNPMVLSIPV